MKIKLLKQYLHSVNSKGILFLVEILFVFLFLAIFILAYSNINYSYNDSKIINYYKCQDIFVLSVAKNLSINEIKDLIQQYLPNSDYVIDDKNTKIENLNNNKKECYAKTILIYNDFPTTKKEMYIKICS